MAVNASARQLNMALRIAVTGKKGQVAQSLRHLGTLGGIEVILIGRPELDLVDRFSVSKAVEEARPDVIVSAAAYTAVDKAESAPGVALAINAVGAGAVSNAARDLGIPIIHLSTDYVFDGSKQAPYLETDICNPSCVYGLTKLQGETCVSTENPNHLILRTSWIYSPFGYNFVKTMLLLAETNGVVRVVDDQRGCPTSAIDLAAAIVNIAGRLHSDADRSLRGTFHLCGSGSATWADFAETIFDQSRKLGHRSVHVERITTAQYPTPAKRPIDSRLDCGKMAAIYGIHLPTWQNSTEVAVEAILREPI